MLEFFSFNTALFFFTTSRCLPPPKRTFLSLNRILKALAPIVEKLLVRLLLAALKDVKNHIKAQIPNAIMATVIPVLKRLLLIFRQDNFMVSFKVIFSIHPKVNYRKLMAGKNFYEWYAGCNCNMIAVALIKKDNTGQ